MRLSALVGVSLLLTMAGPVMAEMGSADYAADGASLPAGERRVLLDAFEAEAEAARMRELKAVDEAELALQARLAARSPAEILVDERCTLCHDAGNYTSGSHTVVGWVGVILRMRWVNGAELQSGQSWVIARHLAETYSAPPLTAFIEIGGAAGIALMPAIGLWWWWRPKRQARRRSR